MQAMAERFYTEEQAQEILRMAAQASEGPGSISHSQLLQTAAELGIRPEEVLQAENAFIERQALEADRLAFGKHKFKEFLDSISHLLSAAVLLTVIALITRGFVLHGLLSSWLKWPLGFFALFLVKETIQFGLDMTVYREATFDKWRQKRALKAGRKTNVDSGQQSALAGRTDAQLDTELLERNQVRS